MTHPSASHAPASSAPAIAGVNGDLDASIDLDFIRNAALHAMGRDARNGDAGNGSAHGAEALHQDHGGTDDLHGCEAVASYHRALFWNQHGLEMERAREDARLKSERLDYLDEQLDKADAVLSDRNKWVSPSTDEGESSEAAPKSPWNGWDLTMFIASLLGILSLLAFGVFNISFNLLESGIVTFQEHPIRAYFWAALLPVGALAVKIGWDLLAPGEARQIYIWVCLSLGLLGVIAWLGAYAAAYPTLTQSTEDTLIGLSVFDDEASGDASWVMGSTKVLDVVLVSAQATAEIFLSALLGIFMTILYKRHQPKHMVADPVFRRWDAERRSTQAEIVEERQGLAVAKGTISRLENKEAAFLSLARNLYQKEAQAVADESRKRHLALEEIEGELRRRLGSVGPRIPEQDKQLSARDGSSQPQDQGV